MVIIELVGPAGSGKSTLTRALVAHGSNIEVGLMPHVHNIRNSPFFLWNGGLSLPTLFALYRNKKDKSLAIQEMITMAILKGWPHQLEILCQTSNKITVLDQGPVYMMAEMLYRYGTRDFPCTASDWWRQVCYDWAHLLDVIICLDATDAILTKRVRARRKSNQIKRNSDEWAVSFLARYREALSQVLRFITAEQPCIQIIQINTSHITQSDAIQRILSVVHR